MRHLTITLAAPEFAPKPGWTAMAIAHKVKELLAENCDLPGLAVIEAVES